MTKEYLYPPIKPVPPTKMLKGRTVLATLDEYDTWTLADLLSLANNLQPADVVIELVEGEYYRDYCNDAGRDDCYCYHLQRKVEVFTLQEMPNPNYEKLFEQYEKDLEKYKENRKKYNQWKKETDLKSLEEQLAELEGLGEKRHAIQKKIDKLKAQNKKKEK